MRVHSSRPEATHRHPSRHPGPARTVHSISALQAPAREDRDSRLRRYLLSMGIRTACFALAGVVHLGLGWTVVAWILMGAALVLPYPAVVFANNVNHKAEVRAFTSPTRPLPDRPDDTSAPAPSGQERP